MKIQDLLQLLSGFQADADLSVLLSANSTEMSLSSFKVGFSVAPGTEEIVPEKAVSVCLYEAKPEGQACFDDQIRLGIPDELVDFCAQYKIEPEELLHGFIADLCGIRNPATKPRADGLSSNGSDERDLAFAWFDRAGYTWRNNDEAA